MPTTNSTSISSKSVVEKPADQGRGVAQHVEILRDILAQDYQPLEGEPRGYTHERAALEAAIAALTQPKGDSVVTIGDSRCVDEEDWFRELTVEGVTFLVRLDEQEKGRHILASIRGGSKQSHVSLPRQSED